MIMSEITYLSASRVVITIPIWSFSHLSPSCVSRTLSFLKCEISTSLFYAISIILTVRFGEWFLSTLLILESDGPDICGVFGNIHHTPSSCGKMHSPPSVPVPTTLSSWWQLFDLLMFLSLTEACLLGGTEVCVLWKGWCFVPFAQF